MCSPLKEFLLIVYAKATIDKGRFWFWLRCVQFICEVCCTPQRSSPRWVAHRRYHLHCILHTAEIDSGVCSAPLRWSPQYVAHCWDHLHGVLHAGETTLWSNISTKLKPNLQIYCKKCWLCAVLARTLLNVRTLNSNIFAKTNFNPHLHGSGTTGYSLL